MTRKQAIVAAAALLGALGIVLLPSAFDRALKARFVGTEHVYQLADRPEFLTEELAISKVRETLARGGFDPNVWTLVADSRSASPDGRADVYFVRSIADSNRGTFTVRDPNGSRRFVQVELSGHTVKSCVVRPK